MFFIGLLISCLGAAGAAIMFMFFLMHPDDGATIGIVAGAILALILFALGMISMQLASLQIVIHSGRETRLPPGPAGDFLKPRTEQVWPMTAAGEAIIRPRSRTN